MDVTMIRWPDEQARRSRISLSGEPRLLLVPDGEEPPAVVDCLEDWIRIPATENEVRARVDALAVRSLAHLSKLNGNGNGHADGNGNGHGAPSAAPILDDFGVLRVNGSWVALPPLEARLTEALLERLGAVTSRELLVRAGWPAGAPGRNALDVHVLRLRRRLAPVGLVIRTVRSRGYLLEPAPA
jgi:two-component system OmpR family response regulator